MESLAYIVAGIVIGAIATWMALRALWSERLQGAAVAQAAADQRAQTERERSEALSAEKQREAERRAAAETAAARVPVLEAALEARSAALAEREAALAGLHARVEEERKSAAEKLALLDDAQRKLTDTFEALSAAALKSNNQSFLELANSKLTEFQQGAKFDLEARQKAVDELVRPLRESLAGVDGKLGELEKARVGAYAALNEQLRGLVETHLPQLHSETANLVKALRQPIVRGRWGEIQLKRVVEMAGMLDHCDFAEQQSQTTESGRLRPDLVVRLPGGKQIVVDAKAPVSAYMDAAESQDETSQRAFLIQHARQVRDHMVALGRKSYWAEFNPTPEFVVLFLPGEMFFSAALQQDPELIEFGVNEKVIVATPTTLIALLRAASYGWRQEIMAQNAQEIADLGREMFKRLSDLTRHWTELGLRLDRAVESYNKSVGTLERRVLSSARDFKRLGAAAEGVELDAPPQIERLTRTIQSPDLFPAADEGEPPVPAAS